MAGNSIILHRAPVSIKKSKATLDSLLSTVERGFAAVADDITDIKSKMATKDDINSLDTKLTKFEEREIDKRLLLEVRVSAIEKHLGIDKKFAACAIISLSPSLSTRTFVSVRIGKGHQVPF